MSEAFPPDYDEIPQLASVHEELKNFNIQSISVDDLVIRKIASRAELAELKLLHKEWFPVNYDDYYFEKSYSGKIENLVIVLSTKEKDLIIGAALFKLKNADSTFYSRELKDFISSNYCVYIMTIGVIEEFRRMRIGQILLNSIISKYKNNFAVKYICLDVIDYNNAAIKFYIKNGFIQMQEKIDLYKINNKFYNAYYYIYHLNSQKPRTNGQILKESITWFCTPLDFLLVKPIKKLFEKKKRKSSYEEIESQL